MTRRITLREQAERLTADSPRLVAARNDGRSRAPEKRRLLGAVEDEARRQGREMWTVSRY